MKFDLLYIAKFLKLSQEMKQCNISPTTNKSKPLYKYVSLFFLLKIWLLDNNQWLLPRKKSFTKAYLVKIKLIRDNTTDSKITGGIYCNILIYGSCTRCFYIANY